VQASRLQSDLAARILRMLRDQGAGQGHRLVENSLCDAFNVSRTPIRGALRLLEEQGALEYRTNRGYVLKRPIVTAPEVEAGRLIDEEDQQLFVAVARARNEGRLPDRCSQQEIVRVLDAKATSVARVLRQLAELGLVERKPGNGWSFALPINSGRARLESYAFRAVLEPAGLIAPTFALDHDWMETSRARQLAFRKRKWRDALAMEFFEMNADFHEQLARCSGNRYMLDAVQRQNRLRSFLNIHWVNGPQRVTDSIDEHLAILDALAAGQNRQASALLRDHLASARDVAATVE
jgi:DNA-binding GntR family transcriptional regulator